MMPRRRPRDPGPPPPPAPKLARRVELGADGHEYEVQPVAGARAVKTYRCPGCDQEIPPGKPHVVAWRSDGGEEDRRHWHSACWKNRTNRRPTRRRT
ncbi:MAG: hypothetical protein ACKOB8_03885 [Mycobacterium sp.]